jgi:hypothetical protein
MTAKELVALSDEDLEARLLELAMDDSVGGHRAQAQSSAIRTVLRRRRERADQNELELRQRACAIVNDRRCGNDPVEVEEMDPAWAACIVEAPGWADLFATRRECDEARLAMRMRRPRAGGRDRFGRPRYPRAQGPPTQRYPPRVGGGARLAPDCCSSSSEVVAPRRGGSRCCFCLDALAPSRSASTAPRVLLIVRGTSELPPHPAACGAI